MFKQGTKDQKEEILSFCLVYFKVNNDGNIRYQFQQMNMELFEEKKNFLCTFLIRKKSLGLRKLGNYLH